jgi:hypothetical protein
MRDQQHTPHGNVPPVRCICAIRLNGRGQRQARRRRTCCAVKPSPSSMSSRSPQFEGDRSCLLPPLDRSSSSGDVLVHVSRTLRTRPQPSEPIILSLSAVARSGAQHEKSRRDCILGGRDWMEETPPRPRYKLPQKAKASSSLHVTKYTSQPHHAEDSHRHKALRRRT